ncbi:hypothetical protein P171DRAFT_525869 [Karstenula rhodostoma CBS 690.94]|uniref:Zinc-binding loop region of homing endonuclease domain-containing protein n=1 Tax=Karstenula rhodostoma CBS 690.94 TaxID=1392251 RepID=A0A9P4U6G4_9PLEO|nr:hypothetical protein P171DRAFT_525869 [Karstenula rhodostoma CBS 690.94]
MEDEQARQAPPRKRFFDYLLSSTNNERPTKQRKDELARNKDGKTSGENPVYGNDDHGLITPHNSDLLSGLDDEILGKGTPDDPVRFLSWETGNVISRKHHGSFIELSDDEDEGSKATSQDALKSFGENTVESIRGRTSFVRRQSSPGNKRLASSNDSRSFVLSPSDLGGCPTLLPPPPPSPAHTAAFTKPISTAPSLQGEVLLRNESEHSEDPGGLVKLEEYDLEISDDDDFFEDALLGCDTLTKGGSWNPSCGGVSKEAQTKTWWKQPTSTTVAVAAEEDLFSVPTTQGRNDLLHMPTIASVADEHSESISSTNTHLVASPAPVKLSESIKPNKSLDLSSRKRLFFDNYYHLRRARLDKVLQKYYSGIQGERSPDGCWLYTGGRLPKPPNQGLSMTVTFRHDGHKESLCLNVLVVKKLLEGSLSQEHIDGIVENSWHASHLCGNWTCFNTQHVVLEPGSVNSNRNACFRAIDGPCNHDPKCQKHLKLDKSRLRPVADPVSLGANESL